MHKDTIAALITAPGAAPVAVVRASGPLVREAAASLCVRSRQLLTSPRRSVLTEVRDLVGAEAPLGPEGAGSAVLTAEELEKAPILDTALVVFFQGPDSFTGEDILEIQLHGSSFIVNRVMQNLALLGVRPARPGEFSERAFLNGKIDLIQAESIADLIASETEAQASLARSQLEGKLSHAIDLLGEPLRDLLAEIEAYLDFPEEDIDRSLAHTWLSRLTVVSDEIERYVESYDQGRLQREGAMVVLAGLPNAGKSSLLNALLGEDRAIVTPLPGTTRDTIEERVSLEGLLVRFVDTAGLEESGRALDEPERLGIERSWRSIEQADLVLYIADISRPEPEFPLVRLKEKAKRLIAALNKQDLVEKAAVEKVRTAGVFADLPAVPVSALKRTGLPELRRSVRGLLTSGPHSGQSVLIANERHLGELQTAEKAVERARQAIIGGLTPDLVSIEVRDALRALEEIIGVSTTEEILGRIFSRFCIGK